MIFVMVASQRFWIKVDNNANQYKNIVKMRMTTDKAMVTQR
jgi:hypothetical protein